MDAIQAAKDQSLFRGVNERLLDMNVGFDEVSGDAEFLFPRERSRWKIAASEATRHCSPDAVAGRPPMRASTRPLSSTSCGSPLSSAA
jgi:hypothetical protein